MIIGYARVSKGDDQTTALQLRALKGAGAERTLVAAMVWRESADEAGGVTADAPIGGFVIGRGVIVPWTPFSAFLR